MCYDGIIYPIWENACFNVVFKKYIFMLPEVSVRKKCNLFAESQTIRDSSGRNEFLSIFLEFHSFLKLS